MADTYFFETLGRIHRAGEGAPYAGLKPGGRDLGPTIPLADQALSTGSVDALVGRITDETRRALIERFEQAVKVQEFSTAAVEAGRAYVRAYVTYIHYAERAYEAARQAVAGHHVASAARAHRTGYSDVRRYDPERGEDRHSLAASTGDERDTLAKRLAPGAATVPIEYAPVLESKTDSAQPTAAVGSGEPWRL